MHTFHFAIFKYLPYNVGLPANDAAIAVYVALCDSPLERNATCFRANSTYLVYQSLEVVCLLSEGVGGDTVTEGHGAMGEVMLGQPRHDLLFLHGGPCRHVDDQVVQLLPMPRGWIKNIFSAKFSIFHVSKINPELNFIKCRYA